MPALTSCPAGVARLVAAPSVERGGGGFGSDACAKASEALSVRTTRKGSLFIVIGRGRFNVWSTSGEIAIPRCGPWFRPSYVNRRRETTHVVYNRRRR